MFKVIRITVLLVVLICVALSAWFTQQRTTDWDNTLWIRVYPINADGDPATDRYIDRLGESSFRSVETFMAVEVERYGVPLEQPVRIELGPQIDQQPPPLPNASGIFPVMWWSLKTRLWAGDVTDGLERIEPDVRIFVRYHQAASTFVLDDSVGIRKGMFGIVNGYAGRQYEKTNSFVIAHEFLHTVGASDKYDPGTNQPIPPQGLAEPERSPLYPQRYAEIMGGRVAISSREAQMPSGLSKAVIGTETAREIGLID